MNELNLHVSVQMNIEKKILKLIELVEIGFIGYHSCKI